MEFSSLLIYLKFDMFLRVIYGIVSTKQSGSRTKKKTLSRQVQHNNVKTILLKNQAHFAMSDINPAPRRSETFDHNWIFTFFCSLGFMKSAANRSTSAIYMRIPAARALKVPSIIRAVGLLSL